MSQRVRTALVGIAGYGESYIRSFFNEPRGEQIDLIAGVDPAPERCRQLPLLQTRGVPVYPHLADMFDRHQPELVVLCTPIHLHAEQTLLASARGAAVLCEKPLAGSLHDALRMVRVGHQPGRLVAIGYQWSYSAAIQRLKRDILSGRFGPPKRLKTIVSYPRGQNYFRRNTWAGRISTADGRPVLDSPVNNATAHFLHNMLYLLGDAWNTTAVPQSLQAELYRVNDIENYDNAALRVATSEGVELLFYTAHSMADRLGPTCEFTFENATVTLDAEAPQPQFVAVLRSGETLHYGHPDEQRSEKIWQTAAAVRSGGDVACPAQAALAHTLCVLAAQQSVSNPVVVPKALVEQVVVNDEPMAAVRGLGDLFLESYRANVLLSERHVADWASAGDVVPIEMPNE